MSLSLFLLLLFSVVTKLVCYIPLIVTSTVTINYCCLSSRILNTLLAQPIFFFLLHSSHQFIKTCLTCGHFLKWRALVKDKHTAESFVVQEAVQVAPHAAARSRRAMCAPTRWGDPCTQGDSKVPSQATRMFALFCKVDLFICSASKS